MQECVLCRGDSIEDPSDDHIIPQGLGGWVSIPNVCGTCNNVLGHELEGQYKKNGYIATALQAIGFQPPKEAYRFSEITVQLEKGGDLRALFDDAGQIRLIPQPSPDDPDSMLIPDEETKKVLKTQIARYEKKTGTAVNFDLSIIDDLPKDVIIPIPGTNIQVAKRSHKSKSVLYSGLDNPIPYRGIAFLSLKQLAALSPDFILKDEFDPIRRWIRYDEGEAHYVVLNNPVQKVNPSTLEYRPYHYLLYSYQDGALGCLVVLFEQLAFSIYLADLPGISDDTINQFLDKYILYDIENKSVYLHTTDDERYQQERGFIRSAIMSGRYVRANGPNTSASTDTSVSR